MVATLYEQINDSIAAVGNWTTTTYRDYYWLGAILSQRAYSDFDTLITTYKNAPDWEMVAAVKEQCEIIGRSNATIDTAVKAFLNGRGLFSDYALPKNDVATGDYFIGYCYELHGYRWAQELNYLTSKWNASSAYNGLHTCYVNKGDPFYLCNPDTGTATIYWDPDPRLFECNDLAKSFYILWKESNIAAAENDFLSVWNDTQNNYSATAPAHYAYIKTGTPGWVWDGVPEMMQVFGRYHYGTAALNNFSRVLTHLDGGYITNGFDAYQWRHSTTDYEFIVHLNPGNTQRRMRGQALAYAFMNQCYPIMSDTQKTTFRNMLSGTGHTQAWVNMKNATAAMFDADKFRLESNEATSDMGTAVACVIMLVQGVRPADTDGGCLAIPLRTAALGSIPMFDPECFRWDGANYKVRIPVFAGNLTFMYNTTLTYNFPSHGVYEVTFNSTYTQIANVTKLGNLPIETYIMPVPEEEEDGIETSQMWKDLIHQATTHGTAVSVTWRPLTLGSDADPVTGWFPRTYGSETITVIIHANSATFNLTGAGVFSTLSYTLFTDSPIADGDRVVYNQKHYELRNTQPYYIGDKLQRMQADMVYLPFGGD